MNVPHPSAAVEQSQFSDNLKYWKDGAYFEGWYPICLSDELEPGKLLGRDFLGTRVLAYRRESDGTPVVQSAYCPHLGADVSEGELVEGEARCPYHHWRFNSEGQCTHVPSGDPIPRVARLQNYTAAESWGLVWAYHGSEPVDLPNPPNLTEEDAYFRSFSRPAQPVDAWIPTSNAVDFQHLRTVHKFPAIFVPKSLEVTQMSLGYEVEGPAGVGMGRVYGCNTFALRPVRDGGRSFTLFTATAVSPGICKPYFVVGFPKSEVTGLDDEAIAQQLRDKAAFASNLYAEDEAVLNTIRFRPRGVGTLVKSDKHLGAFLNYINAIPRSRPLDA